MQQQPIQTSETTHVVRLIPVYSVASREWR